MNKTLLLGVVSIMLIGCSNNTMRSLEQLETRIDHVPDSVLHELSSMDGTIKWGEARALHALLTVRAQDKCDLLTGNDSIITIATNYYSKHGNPERRLFAHIYAGRVYSAAGNSQKAIELYTEALKYEDQTDNYYALGLLYSDIATEYSWAYDYVQAIENMEKSLNYYGQAGKERHQILAKSSLGLYYLNSNNYVEAEPYLTEVLAWGELNDDGYIIRNAIDRLITLYSAVNDATKMTALLDKYPLHSFTQNTENYSNASYYYAYNDNIELSKQLLDTARKLAKDSRDTTFLWHKQYLIYKKLGNSDSALSNIRNLFFYQDSVLRITLQQPLLKVQRDYYQSELELSEMKNQNRRLTIVLITFSVFVFFFVLWYIYRERIHANEEKIRDYIDVTNELRQKLSAKDEEINLYIDTINEHYNKFAIKDKELKEQLNNIEEQQSMLHLKKEELEERINKTNILQKKISILFAKECRILNGVCEAYYEHGLKKGSNKNIVNQLESVIRIFNTDSGYASLEKLINEYKDNIMLLLRTEFPKFKETDYRIICYFCANFSAKTISLITGLKQDTVLVYKGRYIKRIEESNQPSKEIILSHIPYRTKFV